MKITIDAHAKHSHKNVLKVVETMDVTFSTCAASFNKLRACCGVA